MSRTERVSIKIAGKEIPVMELETKPSGQYVIFPMTKNGLVYSIHPTGNPHVHDKNKRVAELDLQLLKEITPDDFKTLFRYPKLNRDVWVIPYSSFVQVSYDSMEVPSLLNKVFESRIIYFMRARRLRQFFQAKPGNYLILDPRNENRVMLQFKTNELGPMNIDMKKGSPNPRIRNMFSIHTAIMKAHRNLPEFKPGEIEVDDFTVSEWGAITKTILGQVQIVRWTKGGKERLLGTMLDRTHSRKREKIEGPVVSNHSA